MQYNIDITEELIPIRPAAHYAMGGVKTDLQGRTSLPGLYAAGEVACTGVHGANRLASNSLLEALVFGGRAAAAMKKEVAEVAAIAPEVKAASQPVQHTARIRDITWRHAGIVRNADMLKSGLKSLSDITQDSNLLTVSRMIHECALAREESRGAHYRDDFPSRLPDKLHSYVKKGQPVRLA